MRVFITGISSGIGKECVKTLIKDGHEVWGVARRQAILEELAVDLNSDAFHHSSCDVSDSTQMDAVHQRMIENDFLPDVIILNAAVDIEDEYPAIDYPAAVQTMRTNIDGGVYWVAAFIEPFLKRGTGQFIGMSSIFAHWPDGAAVSYSASKTALSMFVRGCRIRYRNSGLAFKLVYLGPVDTSINPRFANQPPTDSLIVVSAKDTAKYVARIIDSSRNNFYFPLYILVLFTFLRWLPDVVFEFLTSPVKR